VAPEAGGDAVNGGPGRPRVRLMNTECSAMGLVNSAQRGVK
jgi:hypothetical protein